MHLYLSLICIQRLTAQQEILVLHPGHNWLRELAQVEFEQRGHGVHIRIPATCKEPLT